MNKHRGTGVKTIRSGTVVYGLRGIQVVKCCFLFAACSVACGAGGAEMELKDLRHCGVRPDSLDYVLMSVVDPAASRPSLSFNHRDGTTRLVRDGDAIGPYTVLSHEQHTKRVFDPSVNARRTEKEVTVKLESSDGQTIELRQGVSHPLAGFLATLVSLETGAYYHVREGDTMRLADGVLQIRDVSEEAVVGRMLGRTARISPFTDDEGNALAARHRVRQEALAERRKAAREEAAREESEARVAQRPVGPRGEDWWLNSTPPLHYSAPPSSGTGIQLGTEYRYPVAWEVLPLRTKRNGKIVITPIAVPTEFETRRTGYGGVGTSRGKMRFPKPVPTY